MTLFLIVAAVATGLELLELAKRRSKTPGLQAGSRDSAAHESLTVFSYAPTLLSLAGRTAF